MVSAGDAEGVPPGRKARVRPKNDPAAGAALPCLGQPAAVTEARRPGDDNPPSLPERGIYRGSGRQ